MKKIQTLLMMFSLFFLFSFSYAGTVTINGDSYDIPEMSDRVITHEDMSDYIFVRYDYYSTKSIYKIVFFDESDPSYSLFSCIGRQFKKSTTYGDSYLYRFLKGSTTYNLLSPELSGYMYQYSPGDNYENSSLTSSKVSLGYQLVDVGMNLEVIHSTYPIYNIGTESSNWTLGDVYYEPNSEDKIVMENPLSDEEIKSILEIFLESVRNSDLPEHYGRYVLTYNKVTGRYTGFVYPNYIDLGIKYGDFNENEKFYYVQDSVGNYYHFSIYEKDTSAEWFTDYLIYEFRSNSTNTFFNFNTTYKLYDKLWGEEIPFISSTLDEPIIYTSHKIYSMFFQETIHSTGNNIFYLDEETSIIKQEFKDDVGIDIDNSINESTNTNTNVNLLSFIKVLFDFIFSLVSFLVRFFAFIVTFIIVPASTTILPEGFVQGIDWIHSFAFGEVLLWDIFTISFGVLLSIYIVKLIRSH